jgi:hypothetical protein
VKSIPSRRDLLIQILLLLENVEPGLTAAEIDSKVAESLNFDESVTKLLHAGTRTKYSYEMAWARSMGKKEGQLVLKGRLWSVANETIRP